MFEIPIVDMNYLILLRELIIQGNKDVIYSDCYKASVDSLDISEFPTSLAEVGLSRLNTTCKVNINYVLSPIYHGNAYKVHPLFYDVLIHSKYSEDKNNLIFRNKEDYLLFLLFKKFKTVNADFYDIKTKNIKRVMHTYQSHPGFKKLSYNTDYKTVGLGPNSIILLSPEGREVYSNKILIEFDDFFIYNEDTMNFDIKDIHDVIPNIFAKLERNKIILYTKEYHPELWPQLEIEIINNIESLYKEFEKIIYTNLLL